MPIKGNISYHFKQVNLVGLDAVVWQGKKVVTGTYVRQNVEYVAETPAIDMN